MDVLTKYGHIPFGRANAKKLLSKRSFHLGQLLIYLSDRRQRVGEYRINGSQCLRESEERRNARGKGGLAADYLDFLVHLGDIVCHAANIFGGGTERIKLQQIHVAVEGGIEIGREWIAVEFHAAGSETLENRRGSVTGGGSTESDATPQDFTQGVHLKDSAERMGAIARGWSDTPAA